MWSNSFLFCSSLTRPFFMVESTTLAHLLSSPLPHLENAEGTLQVLEKMQSQYLVLY